MAIPVIDKKELADLKRTDKSNRLFHSLQQFLKFGVVGGSGTIVNLSVVFISKKIAGEIAGVSEHDVLFNLFGTQYNLRWYALFVTIAFFVANTWNYQLNRKWIFQNQAHHSWWRGFFPFLFTGIAALLVSLGIMPFLMNPGSPVALSEHFFDDSTGFRTKFYWASAISIIMAMPINFLINKFWVFRKKQVPIIK